MLRGLSYSRRHKQGRYDLNLVLRLFALTLLKFPKVQGEFPNEICLPEMLGAF